MRCVLKTNLNRTLLVRGVDANTVPRPVHPVWSGGGGGSVLKAFLLRLLPPDPLSSPVSLVTLVFCHLEVNLPLPLFSSLLSLFSFHSLRLSGLLSAGQGPTVSHKHLPCSQRAVLAPSSSFQSWDNWVPAVTGDLPCC